MRQSLLLLFASVYYTVENLCVERRKLFDKRHWDLQTRGLLGHTGEFALTSLRCLCLHDDPCLPAGQRHASDGPYE